MAERASYSRRKAMELGNTSVLAGLESQQLLVETPVAELEINRAKIASLDAAIFGLDQKIVATTAEIRTTAPCGRPRQGPRNAWPAPPRRRWPRPTRRADLQTLPRADQRHRAANAYRLPHNRRGCDAGRAARCRWCPYDDRVEVEAVLENRDVGSCGVGPARVEVKIDAFPFTRYGTISGRVRSVSHDAVQDQSQAAPTGEAPTQAQSEAQHPGQRLGLVYPARISLERTVINIDGNPTLLGAGMAVTVEIKTDRRRIIEYLLSPLLRYRQDSLHER